MYRLRFKYDGLVYQRDCAYKYKPQDLRPLFHDFVMSRTYGGIIPLADAENIIAKSIAGSNYLWI